MPDCLLLVLFSSATGQEDSNPHPSSALSPAFHSHLEARCHSFMYQGLASSTRRTYSCTREKFVNFCFMTGHLSPYGSPCPASDPLTLCLFATYLADSLRHSSIKVYLSAVWSLHVDQRFPDPLENCLRLQRVVRGIKHSQGALPSRLRLPVSSNILRKIFSALDLKSFDNVMFWAASKTDPFRKGCNMLIGMGSPPLCAVQAVVSYLAHRGHRPGPLFLQKMVFC